MQQVQAEIQPVDEVCDQKDNNCDGVIPVEETTALLADFHPSLNSGCAPLTVDFTNMSTGSDPTTWQWDFGDKSEVSTVQNPSHTYTLPGTYTVTLTATDACNSDLETKVGLITVTGAPKVHFSANHLQGCCPLTVNFTDLSANNPTSWEWDFGDDPNSISQNPVHTYTKPGTYTVSLTAGNNCGQDNLEQAAYIIVKAQPVADFVINDRPGELNINFKDQSSGGITSWSWDFGDGKTSQDQNPSHPFTAAGSYKVKLIVSNGDCT